MALLPSSNFLFCLRVSNPSLWKDPLTLRLSVSPYEKGGGTEGNKKNGRLETRGIGKGKVAKGTAEDPPTNGDSCLSYFNENLLLRAYNLYLRMYLVVTTNKTVNSSAFQSNLPRTLGV
jgi:hypothetical protein